MAWHPSTSLNAIKSRAELLSDIRQFFMERGVLEVETPLLAKTAATHPYLRPMSAYFSEFENATQQHCYLQTSPEFAMKRLLAAYNVPMYQICKAFRNGEVGRFHNPEFTMLEWYRPGFNHHDLMDEMDEFLIKTLNVPTAERLNYKTLFQHFFSIDPHQTTIQELESCAEQMNIYIKENNKNNKSNENNKSEEDFTVDDWLDILMSHCIEPQLGLERPVMIYDYPSSKAALAKLSPLNNTEEPKDPAVMVAERFEVYFKGIELANAYHELTDPVIQLQRFNEDNELRKKQGLPIIPIDHFLIEALENGLPDAAGVALGLDRLLMLKLNSQSIQEVISFPFDRV